VIAAVLLAAGRSTRMGTPKLLLPWGEEPTVIAHVIQRYQEAGVDEIFVVTGAERRAVEAAVDPFGVRSVFNPRYEEGEMLSSLQVGLREVDAADAAAALISPADIPDVLVGTIRALIGGWGEGGGTIVAPSFEFRRGHPILLARSEFAGVLRLPPGDTLRRFLRENESRLTYIDVDDPGILRDIDTPEDYRRG
jgi:molybdenum cofactor cytidylyltransferase